MRQKGSFWNWYKIMGILEALKCRQNLYQVVVCPCPGAFFQMMTLGWPHGHFYDRVKFVSSCFCMSDRLYNIKCSCISKFVLIQHILSTQVSDTGPMVLWFIVLLMFLWDMWDIIIALSSSLGWELGFSQIMISPAKLSTVNFMCIKLLLIVKKLTVQSDCTVIMLVVLLCSCFTALFK